MKIIPQLPPYAPAFGYNSIIKTLWLKGQLPTVKKGLEHPFDAASYLVEFFYPIKQQ